jgi:hypothetical protein
MKRNVETGPASYPDANNTYLRSWALLEKLQIVQLLKNIPAILRNPKVHRRVHKRLPLVPILSQNDPIYKVRHMSVNFHADNECKNEAEAQIVTY